MPLETSVGPMNPADVVLPLFALDSAGNINHFLGTCFCVGDEPLFITAGHNVKDWDGQFGLVHISDLSHLYLARPAYLDNNADVAILDVRGYRPKKRLGLGTDDSIVLNQQIVCFEYGTTIQKGKEIILAPASRFGNVTRKLDSLELLGRKLSNALELSFPALRGASGAPVLSNVGLLVWGMVVGNTSYHLIPAQIETTTDEAGKTNEQVMYMLPLAIAVNVSSIRETVDRYLSALLKRSDGQTPRVARPLGRDR